MNFKLDFTSYLIIGSGRIARHFQYYFSLEKIPYQTWCRKHDIQDLDLKIEAASHVLLLISDPAIDSFFKEHPRLAQRVCVHFSGALVSEFIPSAHPLMTFGDILYDLETYRRIPFIIEKERASAEALLPHLQNQTFQIRKDQKTLYHALCVMSGNFTVLLWEKVFSEFEKNLGLPREVLHSYLRQTAMNLENSSPEQSVLTGPLVRNDRTTIQKHTKALANDPYSEVYLAFVEAFFKDSAIQCTPGGGK